MFYKFEHATIRVTLLRHLLDAATVPFVNSYRKP